MRRLLSIIPVRFRLPAGILVVVLIVVTLPLVRFGDDEGDTLDVAASDREDDDDRSDTDADSDPDDDSDAGEPGDGDEGAVEDGAAGDTDVGDASDARVDGDPGAGTAASTPPGAGHRPEGHGAPSTTPPSGDNSPSTDRSPSAQPRVEETSPGRPPVATSPPTTRRPASTTTRPPTTTAPPTTRPPSTTAPGPSPAAIQSEIIAHHNQKRAENGLPPLQRLSCLDRMAQNWSDGMANRRSIGHRGGLGGAYLQFCGPYQFVSENIGRSQHPIQLLAGWWHSSDHRTNILGDVTHVGVGLASGGDGLWYVTVNFSRPA